MKKTLYFFVFVIVTIAIFLWVYSKKIINSFNYEFNKISFTNFDIKKISGTFGLKITSFAQNYTLKEVLIDVYINDVFITTVKQNKETESINNSILLNLDFSVKPAEFIKLEKLNVLLADKKTINYKGYAKIKKLISVKIPIDYKFNV